MRTPFQAQCETAIESIMVALRPMKVAVGAVSYGKDSSVVMGLTMEALRRLKAEGQAPIVRIVTSDTRVENPSMIKLARTMSSRTVAFGQSLGLDIEQIWVTPDPADHYLVQMISGRGTASVASGSANCSVDMKVRPMEKARRLLARTYGAENICVLIGTRFEESQARGAAMTARGESATEATQQDTGSWRLSPIAHWPVEDVWRFLNGSEKTLGFAGIDYAPVLAQYESMQEETCGTLSVDTAPSKQASPCSGGRGGCFLCMRVSTDKSLEAQLSSFPAYEPLVRLRKVILAGHFVPENRSFLAKSVDDQGRIRVFSNGYSAAWTATLLGYVMTIDADEDARAEQASARRGRPVARRFDRLLDEESLMLIAFGWARYGLHSPGEFIRIREAVAQGVRFEMPSDTEIEALAARADKRQIGKTLGHLRTHTDTNDKPVFRDHWRDLIGTDSLCAPDLMRTDAGERAWYTAGTGARHDAMANGDLLEASLDHLRETSGELGLTYEDFMWWYASEFAGGRKTHNDEMAFLVRQGVIAARNGYQSQLASYQSFNVTLDDLRTRGDLSNAQTILTHPDFAPADTRLSASPVQVVPAEAAATKPDQLNLFEAA